MKSETPVQDCVVLLEYVKIYKCDRCSQAFLNQENLSIHTEQHKQKFLTHALSAYVKLERVKPLKCDTCTESFSNKRELILHKLKHVQESVRHSINQRKSKLYNDGTREKPFKCPQCDYRFVAQSTLDAHAAVHLPFPYICHCSIGYYKLEDLSAHQKLVKCQYPHDRKIEPNEKFKDKSTFRTKPAERPPRTMLKAENTALKKKKTSNGLPRKKSEAELPKAPQLQRLAPKLLSLDVEFVKNVNKRFQCPSCDMTLASKTSAEVHYRAIHRKERPYACHICNKTFSQISGLNTHIKVHAGLKNFSCSYCSKCFVSLSAQMRHERTHTGYKPYQCGYCDKAFSDPSAHARHERIHTGDKKYRCDFCPMAFTDFSGLSAHTKRHGGIKNITCDICKMKFYTNSLCKKHVSTVHNHEYNFSCELCPKYFSSKGNLQMHIKTHSKIRETFPCPVCDKPLSSKNNLAGHIDVVHLKINKYRCTTCLRVFSFECRLKRHIGYHQDLKRRHFDCRYCSNIYFTKSGLSAHVNRKHKSNNCKLCRQYFSSKNDLVKHKLKKEKKCDECDKTFMCKGALRTHLNTHLKFECDHCGDEFKNKKFIIRHILNLHSENKFATIAENGSVPEPE